MQFDQLKRRQFIALLGGAAVCPLAARAQQSMPPVVALINGGAPNASAPYAAAFRKGLSEIGYDEQKNVMVEYHWLEGQYARLPDFARQFNPASRGRDRHARQHPCFACRKSCNRNDSDCIRCG